MFDQRIETSIFGNNVKKTSGIVCRQKTQVISNMEIKCIDPGCFKNDVIRAYSQLVHGQNKFDRKLRITRA